MSPSSSGLGHRVFNPITGVRIPVGMPTPHLNFSAAIAAAQIVAAVKEDPGRRRTRRRQIGTSRRIVVRGGRLVRSATFRVRCIGSRKRSRACSCAVRGSPYRYCGHASAAQRALSGGQQSGPGPFGPGARRNFYGERSSIAEPLAVNERGTGASPVAHPKFVG
jgi:hypothetical protein